MSHTARFASWRAAVELAAACIVAGCTAATGTPTGGAAATLTGVWQSPSVSTGTFMNDTLRQNGSTLSGSGVITVLPGIPAATGGGPAWTGDAFTITSGSVSGSSVTFASTLVGANPSGNGGVYHGTLSFTGTLSNGNTLSGTLTYTPPFTLSQTFTQQTVRVTMVRK